MYLQHFGFTSFPFSITAHSNELFFTHQYREATAHIHYSLQHPGGIIVLTGEVGTGKTTLARNFLQMQGEAVDTVFIVNPRVPTPELIETICQELAIKPAKGGTLKPNLDKLHRHLLQAHKQGKLVVILIDEAQHLSFDALEQLRLLTNLETSEGKLVQIILVGQEELRPILAHASLRQFRQRVVGRFHLRPLDAKETGAYIRHRLERANGSPDLIPSSLYRLVYRHTKGVPRLINLVCDRALVGAYALGRKRVDRGIMKQAVAEMLVESVEKKPQDVQQNNEPAFTTPAEPAKNTEFPVDRFAPEPRPKRRPALGSQVLLGNYSLDRSYADGSKMKQAIAEMLDESGEKKPQADHKGKTPLAGRLATKTGLPAEKAPLGNVRKEDPAPIRSDKPRARSPLLAGMAFLCKPFSHPLVIRPLLVTMAMFSAGWLATHTPLLLPERQQAAQLVDVPDGTASPLPSMVLHQPATEARSPLLSPETGQPKATWAAEKDVAKQQPTRSPPETPSQFASFDAAFSGNADRASSPDTRSARSPRHPPKRKPQMEQAGHHAVAQQRSSTASFAEPQAGFARQHQVYRVSPSPFAVKDIDSLAELPFNGSNYAEYSKLLQLWNIDAQPFDSESVPCIDIARHRLTCAHITADLHLVRAIGLPAVLQGVTGAEFAASEFVLVGVNDSHALLWRAGEYYRIATPALVAEWKGTGHYFIQAPQDFRTAFRPESTSDSIAWLIHSLSRLDDKYALDASIASYNEQLIRSVKTFQQQQGLTPDGIAGFRTVALLNQLLFDSPILTTTFD